MPKKMIPSITSTVVTGRRMNSSEKFIDPPCAVLLDVDPSVGREPRRAVDHDLLAERDALVDGGEVANRAPHRDRTHLRDAIVTDDEYIVALLTGEHRARRNRERIGFHAELHAHTHVLTGPEAVPLIREARLRRHGAGQ